MPLSKWSFLSLSISIHININRFDVNSLIAAGEQNRFGVGFHLLIVSFSLARRSHTPNGQLADDVPDGTPAFQS